MFTYCYNKDWNLSPCLRIQVECFGKRTIIFPGKSLGVFGVLEEIQNSLTNIKSIKSILLYKVKQTVLPGTLKGTTSERSPSSCAFLARLCERSAYSSCSSREIAKAAASRSAEWPMVSLVENSATAGSWERRYSGPGTLLTGGIPHLGLFGKVKVYYQSRPRQGKFFLSRASLKRAYKFKCSNHYFFFL